MSAITMRWMLTVWVMAVAAIFVLAMLPNAAPPGVWGVDKIAHFAVFLALAAIPAAILSGGRTLLWTEVLLLAVGLGIEVAQSFIPGRVGSGGDLLADVLGVLAGVVAGRQVWRRLRPTM